MRTHSFETASNKQHTLCESNDSRISTFPSGTTPATSTRTFDAHQLIILGLILVTALIIFAALRFGGDYYLATPAERPQHALHKIFKPSGLIGQGFGVIGGLFCLLTLLYPVRKRWSWLAKFGAQRHWFLYHIYFGIAGPLFATLHTTFKFGGLASICYWSMMLVMASGFIGRFLFALLPRNRRGLTLSLQEIEAEISSIQRSLAPALKQLPLQAMVLTTITNEIKSKNQVGAPTDWITLFRVWTARRQNLRAWNQQLREKGWPVSSTRPILALLSRKLFLEASRVTLDFTSSLFSLWHALHFPFTYLMFITLTLHVGLAIFLGYTWIF